MYIVKVKIVFILKHLQFNSANKLQKTIEYLNITTSTFLKLNIL